ncbi:MAG: hypothetical protein GC168_09935 [Candidatus Hydrogenedens sp.]|nr:hypothetical protein [Candidatus Hydrogenedens sp.]
MILAAIGDFRGEVCTLRATLEAIEAQGIVTVVQTGHFLAGADDPDAAAETAREFGLLVAEGEEERMLLRFQQKQATLRKRMEPEAFARVEAAHARMRSATFEYARGLHKQVKLEIDGIRIIACHGSPASTAEVITPETPAMRLQRHREHGTPDILICGGHPEPFHRWIDGALFVCPGDLMRDGRAWYTTISTETDPWEVRNVPVD